MQKIRYSTKGSKNRTNLARLSLIAAAVLGSTWHSSAFATTYYWDPLHVHSTGGTGTGTWDTSTANWYVSGSNDTTWGGDIAVFANAASTVTIGTGGVSANQIVFSTAYTIAGTDAITLTGTAVVSVTGGSGIAPIISAPLAGSVGATLQGGPAGTLSNVTLTGANTYTGTTTLYGGSWTLGNTNQSTAYVNNGGILKLDFAQGTAPVSDIINSSASLSLSNNGSLTIAGKAGTNNSQSFAGGLTISAGASTATATIGTGGKVLTTFGAITRNAGGTLNFAQPTGTLSSTNGFVTSTSNDAYGLLGAGLTVGGTDWATNNGTNIVALPSGSYTTQTNAASWGANQNITNNAAYSGTLGSNLTIGSLRFNNAAVSSVNLGGNTLTVADGILLTSTVAANASTISGGTLQGAAGKDLVIINNNTGALTISSTIANNTSATALTKSGTGVLTLSGSNSYTGGTYINAGTVNINNSNALGSGSVSLLTGTTFDNTSGSPVTITNPLSLGTNGSVSSITYAGSNGGVLNVSGNITIQTTTTQGNLANSGSSFTLVVNGGTLNLAGDITATAPGYVNYMIVKNGTGTLALSGNNTFLSRSTPSTNLAGGGGLLFRGGTIALNNANALGGVTAGAGGLNVAAGAYVDYIDNTSASPITLLQTPFLSLANNLTFTGTQSLNYGTGNVTLSTNPILTIVDKSLTLGGVVSGAFALTKAGAGTLILTGAAGANTYSGGTTINAGTVLLTKTLALPSSGTYTVNNTGTLAVNAGGTGEFSNATSGAGSLGALITATTWAAGSTLGVDTTNATGGTLTYAGVIGGNAGLNKLGSGTLALSNTNTFAGATTVTSGTLSITGSGSINGTSGITINGGTLQYGSSVGLTQPVSFAGTGGKLVLNGSSSYAGPLTITSGNTLGGSGTYSNTVTMTGGTLAPGNSPGTITVGALSMDANTVLSYDLNATDHTTGSNINDYTVVNGNLVLDGTLNLASPTELTAGTYTLIHYTGALTDNGLLIGSNFGTAANQQYAISNDALAGNINLVVTVPEPATATLLGGISALGLLARRRRQTA